jgi:CheY-like chemotaxis protein
VSPRAEIARPRVLIVEDEPDHRRALALTLRLGGYEPLESASGEEALAACEAPRGSPVSPAPDVRNGGEWVGAATKPDALVLDVRLPGIDGVAVLERLRGALSTRRLPIVLVSAHANIPNAVQEDPRSRFLPKPFHPDQLLEQLAELLADRGGQAR